MRKLGEAQTIIKYVVLERVTVARPGLPEEIMRNRAIDGVT